MKYVDKLKDPNIDGLIEILKDKGFLADDFMKFGQWFLQNYEDEKSPGDTYGMVQAQD